MFCQKCSAALPDDAKFCSKCGAKLEKEIPEKVFCTKCGKQYPRTQMFCTNCGNRLDVSEEIIAPTGNTYVAQNPETPNLEQAFPSIAYALGEVTGFTFKTNSGSLLFTENRIEVYKESGMDNMGVVLGGTLGGALGGAIVGVVEGALAARASMKKRNPNIVIPYANIVRFRPSKYIVNPSVILNLNDCTSYTFMVEKKQSEILAILRRKCPQCEAAAID